MRAKFEYIVYFSIVAGLCFVLPGCKKNDSGAAQPVAQVVEATPTPTPAEQKEKPVYVYMGDRFRDPFYPAGASSNYQPEAVFDPQRSTLRGIIFSPSYKSAVMTISGSGSYYIKDTRIFDVMGKTVKGFTAKVLKDRVIVTSESDNTYEIKMKNPDEEEAKPT